MFKNVENNSDAAGYQNYRKNMVSILFCIFLEQEKQIKNLQEKTEKLEK